MQIKNKTIALALSGGGDSYLAGKILLKNNKVFAIYINHLGNSQSLKKAKESAKKLGIKLHILDLKKEFKSKVINYFIKEHKNSKNPNPCVICNKEIKFGILLKKAKQLGADYLATGHYARIVKKENRFYLKRAKDKSKDQSYAMAVLKQNQLKKIVFPLGNLEKKQLRKQLEKEGFKPEPETNDLCFLKGCKKENFLSKHLIQTKKEIFLDNKKIKEIKDIFPTRGQRKGLQVNTQEKLYLNKTIGNKLFLGRKNDLLNNQFQIKNFNCIFPTCKNKEKIGVMIRDKQKTTNGYFYKKQNLVKLNKKVFGISKGQLAVFYKKDFIFGGGWITKIL